MPKKRQPFICFVQHMGRSDPSNRGLQLPDLVNKYGEVWKQMSSEERKPYEDESKGLRVNRNRPIYTSQGRELSVELQERHEAEQYEKYLENLLVRIVYEPPDVEKIKNRSFFFVSFNVMVRTQEGVYLADEIGIVEYSISRGILNSFHQFIDPGDVPIGYARLAKEHMEKFHKIPMTNFAPAIGNERYEDGTRNMEARNSAIADLVLEIVQILNGSKLEGGDGNFIVFCAAAQMAQVKGCFKFLCEQSGEFALTAERFTVLDVTRLLMVLASRAGKKRPYGICEGDLNKSTYNYSPNTNCDFHDELDTYHCALGVAKRYCYMLSDVLCELYDVKPTERHFPPEPETNFEVRDVVGFSNVGFKQVSRSNRYFNDHGDEDNVGINEMRNHNIRPPREFPSDPRSAASNASSSQTQVSNRAMKQETPAPSGYVMGIGRGRSGIRVPQQKPNV